MIRVIILFFFLLFLLVSVGILRSIARSLAVSVPGIFRIIDPCFFQWWCHSGHSIMATPPLAPMFGWLSGPWCIRVCPPLICIVKSPARCVSCIRYACILCFVIVLAKYSSFCSFFSPCTFWLTILISVGGFVAKLSVA